MTSPPLTDILNELLIEEGRALAPRLMESTLFVSRLSMEDHSMVQVIAKRQREHCALLSDLIVQLGGNPWPRQCDARTADLHFQELHWAMPKLESDLAERVSRYDRALEQAKGEPRVAQLLTRIRDRHKHDLAQVTDRLTEVKAS